MSCLRLILAGICLGLIAYISTGVLSSRLNFRTRLYIFLNASRVVLRGVRLNERNRLEFESVMRICIGNGIRMI